jgi:DnaJ-domain-containing protein 1
MPDHYALLGIPEDAQDEDIKAAYRKQAPFWHPDANKRPDAKERFQQLADARDVLLDPARRAEYDQRLRAERDAAARPRTSTPTDEWESTDARLESDVVDFGVLRPGEQEIAEFVLSWAGTAPGVVRPLTVAGKWWEIIGADFRDSTTVFSLRAYITDDMANGPCSDVLELAIDGEVFGVELVVTVAGATGLAAGFDEWAPTSGYAAAGTAGLGLSIPPVLLALPWRWIVGAAAVVLATVTVIHPVIGPLASKSSAAALSNTPQASGLGSVSPSASWARSTPSPTPKPVPQRASTTFALAPAVSFHAASGPASDWDNPGYAVSVVPTYHGDVVTVQLRITYSSWNDPTTRSQIGSVSSMDVQSNPSTPGGSLYFPDDGINSELPLSADLHDNGQGLITGSMSFAAVLPGEYSFDFFPSGGQAGTSFPIGSITTAHLGVANGDYLDADNYVDYSAMAVFAVRPARHDTSLTFGQVGPTNSAKGPGAACIRLANGRTLHPVATSVVQTGSGNGQAYTLGTQTYDVSGSQLNGADFFYNCTLQPQTPDYVQLH